MREIKQKRILLNALHTVTGGGLVYLQNILPHLAEEAERRGWKLILLCPPETASALTIPKSVELKIINITGFFKIMWYEQCVLPFWCYKNRINAVLCNANYTPLLAPKPLPVIHTNPNVRHYVAGKSAFAYGGKFYWPFFMALTRLSLWRAPAAFSVAVHVVPHYSKRTAKTIHITPPACDISQVKPTKKLGRHIIAIGDVYPQKNYMLLLQAFKVLKLEKPNVTLQFIGRIIDVAEHQRMKAYVTQNKLEAAVTLPTPLPHTEVLQAIAGADALAAISLVETFNMPVLEALALGTPVVTGDYDFQKEVAGKAAVYVDLNKEGDTPAALGMALYGVLENPSIRATLVKLGKIQAQKFNWQQTSSTLMQGIESIL